MLHNLRSKLIFVTILAILPAICFIYFLNFSARESKKNEVTKNLQSIANLYSVEHALIIESSKHLLIALSISPELKSSSCSSYLKDVQNKYIRYSNFGVADIRGDVYCSAVPSNQKINISETSFFKAVVNSNDFAIGEYRISPTTNNAVLSVGYPINRGVIYSSIDLGWLNERTRDISSQNNQNTLILDSNGIVLASYPDGKNWVGKSFPSGKLTESIVSQKEGIVEDSGLDNIKRIYAFKQIIEGKNLFVVVGTDTKLIYKETDKDFKVTMILTVLIALISFLFAWVIGRKLIINQVLEIEAVGKLKDDFISLVSHQIRTPLTSIKWFSEIMMNQSKKNNKSLVKDIHESAVRVIKLVSTILDITKIESGKINLVKEEISVKKLIDEVLLDLSNSINEKKIKIIFTTKANTINADFRLIRQVYQNVIGNAIKYSHKGNKVKILIYKSKKNIITKVIDAGIGIPRLEQHKVFTKFSRGTNAISHAPDGSGIGLYLVKLIINAHSGHIALNSREKIGTTVTISIPK